MLLGKRKHPAVSVMYYNISEQWFVLISVNNTFNHLFNIYEKRAKAHNTYYLWFKHCDANLANYFLILVKFHFFELLGWYPNLPRMCSALNSIHQKPTFSLHKYETFVFSLKHCQITTYGLREWNYICPRDPGCLSWGGGDMQPVESRLDH